MIFLWLAILLLAIFLVGLGLSFYMTRRYYLVEAHSPAEKGLPYEDTVLKTSDGLTLRGWWIPAPGSDKAIIQMHGHAGSMDPDLQYIPALHEAGYNVLMFDFRAHGRSEGKISTVGYLERRDVQAAVEFVKKKGFTRIGLLGFSMGGILAMLSAPLCPEVDAVVDDGGPARMRTAMTAWGMERGIPRWLSAPLAWLVLVTTSLRVGANLFLYEPVRWVAKIAPRPILFIHGDHDQYVTDFDDLYAAARPVKELWRVADAGHVTASQIHRDEYLQRVVAFFDKYL